MTAAPALAARPSGRQLAGSLVALAITALLLLASIVLSDAGGVLLVLSYGALGTFLAVRRPGQPIAWLLLVTALGLLLGTTRLTATLDELLAGEADAFGSFTAWANGVGWVFVLTGFTGITLAFPSGGLPRGGWRVVAIAVIGLSVPLALLIMFGPVVNVTLPGAPYGTDVPNPLAIPALAWVSVPNAALWSALYGLTFVGLVSLVARFRRSGGLERLQFRWLVWAVCIVAVANALWALITTVVRVDFAPLAALVVALSYPAIPIAVVVAVLRYRLYDIDRLVSRTLGWGLATAAIVGVFVGAVLTLQAALAGVTQSGTLVVAASTLLAFALFQPVRSRVQAVVDRRFDRPRLEAERILAGHGERLRHETDLERIEVGVLDTVSETLRPASAGLWIRRAGATRP